VSQSQVVGVLIAIEGPLEGEVYRIFDGESTIGRDESCEVRLDHERISRQHARVVHSDGSLAIKPLSDKNPTLVNDVRVEDYIELGDGDTLKLGRTTLRFRSV
jgi:pSer/pThr/pTyr-binding forkhead associated (FHA) protein